MTAIQIKEELKVLIEQERDKSVLKAIRTLLVKTGLDETLKKKLTFRAMQSNEEIAQGIFLSREEMESEDL
jgi:hypothetical protein